MVELLRRRARPVVRVRGDEEPDPHAAPRRVRHPSDHRAVGDVRVHDVERPGRAVHQRVAMASVIGRYLPGALCRTTRGHGRSVSRVLGEERGELGRVHVAAEPAKRGEEDELELRDDGAREPQEHVVEPAVLEVVLDARSADPAGQAVDDDDLAVVDVPELVEVPALLAFCAERAAAARGCAARTTQTSMPPSSRRS